MKRKLFYIIIVLSLIFAVSDYFFAMHDSYNKYVDGEYFFREKAKTVDTHNDTWWATAQAQNADYSDPKTLLLSTDGAVVYAANPHNGYCTVIDGDNVIEDFPLSNLKFDNEDMGYFYGTKKYTYEEYIDIVKGMSKEELESSRVSNKEMANFNKVKNNIFILIGVYAVFAMLLVFLYKAGLDNAIDLVLLVAALYSVFFEIFTAVAF